MGGRSGGRDELSRALRELRQAAHLSTRVAAERTGFSVAKISRVERGINVPTETDVAALVHVYQAPPKVRTHLTSIARDIRAEHRTSCSPQPWNESPRGTTPLALCSHASATNTGHPAISTDRPATRRWAASVTETKLR